MRIAFSCDDDRGLEGVMSYHFGRCPYYAFVDTDDGQIQAVNVIPNPYYGQHGPGVVPAFISSQGAKVMITGGMGARAVDFFNQFGIQVVTGASGTVRYALEHYLGGDLSGAKPCNESRQHEAEAGQAALEESHAPEHDEAGRLQEEVTALRSQLAEVMERLNRVG